MSETSRDLRPEHERAVLVALNAADSLSRDNALRLSRRPRDWLRERDRDLAVEAAGTRPKALAAGRVAARKSRVVTREEERRAARAGASIVTRLDPGFPPSLADLELPPAVLYRRGRLPEAPAVAIVGSRRADPYGLEVARQFAAGLAAAGLVVVSGFAVGIDAAAHRASLEAGGETVAVLGCGIDVDYPRGHGKLGRAIARHGALVSELRMGTAPEPRHFPVRNRIIAALSVGTLVVRAAPRSGSLITARLALELGREVWAVPGNIYDSRSVGANSLIRDGAHPVQRPEEILESLPARVQDRLAPGEGEGAVANGERETGDAGQRAILRLLPRGELIDQDTLIRKSGLPVEDVVFHLLSLELSGRLRRYPGPAYCRRG